MSVKKQITSIFLILILSLMACPCFGDEIIFKNQKPSQTGVVVQENQVSVTIRFPREEIKSINGNENRDPSYDTDKVIWEDEKEYVVLKIPRNIMRTQTQQSTFKPDNSVVSKTLSGNSSEMSDISEQKKLLMEETGHVEGVILWRDKPLQNGKVKIVLEKYTGFSAAALKKKYISEKNSSANDIILETETDSLGRYAFNEAPPGFYRLYWMSNNGTEWIHRLKESPDFEVISGTLTTANIPEKHKMP